MYKHQMWNWDFDLYLCPLTCWLGLEPEVNHVITIFPMISVFTP
jgi:hypothetical protein